MDGSKFLLVVPMSGLCNQLIGIVNGIILAHLSKRVLSIHGFCVDYRNCDYIPIQDVLDIDHLNTIINELELSTQIVPHFGMKFERMNIPAEVNKTIPY